MVNVDCECQLHRISNHLRDGLQGMPTAVGYPLVELIEVERCPLPSG